ncbi:hypothetical protein C0075_14545 [Rhizobium sp. KAs_5_22]|uniref:lysozyme inhibitor LprI family protein n=1 Tax=Ciceribacter selenitireducens TaxID=448181 RepID=UPI0004BB797B|nr:hypothetical protein [Ciceribacter selenitireducens]PPJ46836.1 hypothetical protein C0075_14545 [Rhizobium sp. KAs_5_22]
MPTSPFARLSQPIAALTILASLGTGFPLSATAASFDCDKPDLAADETAICANRDLNDMDVKMVTMFELITGLLPMGNRGVVQDEQVEWLSKRQAFNADLACLRVVYAERVNQLTLVYGQIERPK